MRRRSLPVRLSQQGRVRGCRRVRTTQPAMPPARPERTMKWRDCLSLDAVALGLICRGERGGRETCNAHTTVGGKQARRLNPDGECGELSRVRIFQPCSMVQSYSGYPRPARPSPRSFPLSSNHHHHHHHNPTCLQKPRRPTPKCLCSKGKKVCLHAPSLSTAHSLS